MLLKHGRGAEITVHVPKRTILLETTTDFKYGEPVVFLGPVWEISETNSYVMLRFLISDKAVQKSHCQAKLSII